MFNLSSSNRYFLYDEATGMRKGFDGLSGLILDQLKRDPMSGEVYVFINKSRNRIKLLHWEVTGFTLYYKRLEKGVFERRKPGESPLISWLILMMIIEGISIRNIVKKDRYQALKTSSK